MAWIVNEWTQTTHNWISLNFADFTFDVHEASSPFSTIVDDRMRRNGEHMKINTLKPFAVIEWHFVTMRNTNITSNSFVKQIHAHTLTQVNARARQIVVSVHRRKGRRRKKQQKLHTRAKSQSNATKSPIEFCEIWKSSRELKSSQISWYVPFDQNRHLSVRKHHQMTLNKCVWSKSTNASIEYELMFAVVVAFVCFVWMSQPSQSVPVCVCMCEREWVRRFS